MPNKMVIDLSHWNTIQSWDMIVQAGVIGIIHKYSEGTNYKDPTFLPRRQEARARGLLWGRYHFANDSDVTSQVKNFLGDLLPSELLVLDWEDNMPSNGGKMTLPNAIAFTQKIYDKLGTYPTLYSGNTLKEALGGTPNPNLAKCNLWLTHYSDKPVCPPGWDNPWLWQYSDREKVPGIAGDVDVNHYAGSIEQLKTDWA